MLDGWGRTASYKYIVKVNVRSFFIVVGVNAAETQGYIMLIGEAGILMHDIPVYEQCCCPVIVDKSHIKLSTPLQISMNLVSPYVGVI